MFDPRATGEGLTTNLAVKKPEGAQVGSLTMKGEGTPRNKIALNKGDLMGVLATIVTGTDPNLNNVLITDNEKDLFDTPGERTAIADAVETRFKSLYSAFVEGLEYVDADGADTINLKWLTEPGMCLFGDLSRMLPMAPQVRTGLVGPFSGRTRAFITDSNGP